MKKLKTQKGFSLVELLVAMTIIVILASVIILYITNFLPQIRLTNGAREVVSALRKAQNLATTEQNIHSVRFAQGTNNYSIIRITNGTETILETIQLPSKITILSLTFLNNEVKFEPSGAAQSQGTVTLSSIQDEKITIEVTLVGQVKSY